VRIECIDRIFGRQKLSKERHQRAGFQTLRHRGGGREDQAVAESGCGKQSADAVGFQAAGHSHCQITTRPTERPLPAVLAEGRIVVDQAVVADEVGRMLGTPPPREVVRGATKYESKRGEAAQDQVGIRGGHEADCQIEAFFHQIDHSGRRGEADRNVRIERGESGNRRSDAHCQCGRDVEPQRAAGPRLEHLGGFFGLFDLGEDLDTAFIVTLAGLGETYTSRAAIEEPHAEPLLERLDVCGHNTGR